MTIQYINTGSGANAGDGDSIRSAFVKVNNNFKELSMASWAISSSTRYYDVLPYANLGYNIGSSLQRWNNVSAKTLSLETVTIASTSGFLTVNGNRLSVTEVGINPPYRPSVGTTWYDTTNGRLYVYYDGTWVDASPGSGSGGSSDFLSVDSDILPRVDFYYNIGSKIPFPRNDLLFIENNVYEKYLFEYELSIIHYYVFPNDRLSGLKQSINYLNKYTHHEDNVYNNIDFYMFRMLDIGEKIELNQEIYGDFIPTSTALIKYNNEIIANVRYVNYRIQPDGSYLMSLNNNLSRTETVRTKNALLKLSRKFEPDSNLTFMHENIDSKLGKDTNILGLEDIRLFQIDNKLKCIATSREFSTNSTNSMVISDYNLETNTIENGSIIESPKPNDCEKNWIPINDSIIYNWYPLQIGKIENNKLTINMRIETPVIFKHLRGSSNVIEYNNEYWVVVHGVKYTSPRKYYHMIVVLDKEYNINKYTVPFYFDIYGIEYCLGLLIENNIVYMTSSRNDSNPIIIKTNVKDINKLFMNS
jgi:predicted GH43/DUF377 family glycosyl hydrolase